MIDQLEELFTLVADEAARQAFVDGLVDAVTDPGSSLRVVATLRADLYDRPLGHHRLGGLVSRGAVPLVSMSPAELEQAIVGPAERVGVTIDGPLVAELVAAVTDRPGSLPLLEFTLTELFDQRRSDTVTLDDYRRLGGLSVAVGARAEEIYRSLDARAQDAARLLFLRLVTVGGERPDLRRRTTRGELQGIPALGSSADRLLDAFGSARLLTFDRDPATREPTVEVAHEALLRSWPRLEGWIADEGHGLAIRGDLTVAAGVWDRGGRRDADLYRAARLAAVEAWAADHPGDLTALEQEFVAASMRLRDAEREAERAQLDRQRRANRRLRVAVAAVGLTLVAALVLGLLALRQRNRAVVERAAAERARGRTLATTAAASLADDRSLALLLAVEASRLDDSPVTREALLASLGGDGPFTRTLIPTPAIDYAALAVSADERVAAAKREDGTVDVIDLEQRTVLATGLAGLQIPGGGDFVDIDSTRSLVATSGIASEDGTAVIVHDLETGGEAARLDGEPGSVYVVGFAPGGGTLAVGDPHGRIELYDVADWSHQRTLDVGDDREIVSFAMTADGTRMVVSATPVEDFVPVGRARIYAFDVASGDLLADRVETGEVWLNSLAIDDEGETVVAAGDRLQRYTLDTLEPVGEPFGDALPFEYASVAVSPDGLVAAASGIALDVFAHDEGGDVAPLAVDAPAVSVAFLDGGRTLLTADLAGSLWTWTTGWVDDLGEPLQPEGRGHVTISPAGSTLAVWGSGRGVLLFDTAGLELRNTIPLSGDIVLTGVDFDRDGRRVATLSCPAADYGPDDPCPAELTVWDADTARVLAGPVDAGEVWAWMTLGAAFTGDGDHLVTAEFDGEVQRWDAGTLVPVGPPLRFDDVTDVAGRQARGVDAAVVDGRSLIVAKGELAEAVVWDATGGSVEPIGVMGGNLSEVEFAGDQLVTAQGSGTFQFRDAETLEVVGAPFVTDVASFWFSASDTGLLVSSSRVSGAQLWDVATRQRVSGVLASTSAALSPDGSVLYLGAGAPREQGGGEVARALPIDPDALVAEACERAGRNLTAEEWDRYLPAGEPYRTTCEQWPAAA